MLLTSPPQAPPGRRVVKPSGDIKHMLMSMGEPGKKKRKEVRVGTSGVLESVK